MAGIGFAVERLYPHLFHQGGDVCGPPSLNPASTCLATSWDLQMDGLYGVYRFPPSVVDLSPMLVVARSRGCYGLAAAVCSFELMEVGGGG